MGIESTVKATTGFQTFNFSKEELIEIFKDTLKNEYKSFEFIQSSLRSAKEIFKEGGHVTMKYKDQIFRLQYDNRRVIIDEGREDFDVSNILLDSKPVRDVKHCKNLRAISKLHKNKVYNKYTSGVSQSVYKNYTDLAIRNFIKALISEPPKFNLNRNELDDYRKIIDFIKGFNQKTRVSKQSISNLKNRSLIIKTVPRTKDTESFIKYIKTKFENFDEKAFFSF